jgi:serine/threonine-protein kinase
MGPGVRVGAYEVLAKLGEGGMGEVYRARDTTLNRDVAIKVLPAIVATDPDRLARFRREAEVLASLNHPNIAHVYGVENSSAGPALVMEFVDGQTLDELIAGQPMAWADALPLARQIADALEAAHARGIVHRDLKPANIKIKGAWGPTPTRRPDGRLAPTHSASDVAGGTVKVLDFGLAKAVGPEASAPTTDLADSPTITARATQLGVILGTAAYMAPEQAKGRPVDRRADIWAFGAVLFEMLSGRRAFDGDDVTEVMAAVIKSEPNWDALPAETPPAARPLLRRCLEKDPKRRLRDIADGMLQLDEELARPTVVVAKPRLPRSRGILAFVAGAILALAAAGVWVAFSPAPSRPVLRFPIRPTDFSGASARNDIAVARDGSVVVYRGRNDKAVEQLYLKRRDQLEGIAIRGTEGAQNLFLSPDAQWVGFTDERLTGLFKASIHGGPRQFITQSATRITGADWGHDQRIVFGTAEGLFRVSADGKDPARLTTANPSQNEAGHSWPSIVAPGDLVLFTVGRPSGTPDDSTLAVVSTKTSLVTPLRIAGTSARYLPSGHVVYLTSDGTLWMARFDTSALTAGTASALEEGVLVKTFGGRNFDVTDDGTLVYVKGERELRPLRTLMWVDRFRKETPLPVEPRHFSYPRISPDGTWAALEMQGVDRDIWTMNLATAALARLTVANTNEAYPVWMPDSRRLIFHTIGARPNVIYRRNADGSGPVETLFTTEAGVSAYAVTRDGQSLVMRVDRGIGVLSLLGQPQVRPLLPGTEFTQTNAALSRDGNWIAFQASPSGSPDVVVAPYPAVDTQRITVSVGGGSLPAFSPISDELFYVNRDRRIMRVAYTINPFTPRPPEALFDASEYLALPSGFLGRAFDVSPLDGRFLMSRPIRGERDALPPPEIVVVLNWLDDARSRLRDR